MKNCNFKDNNNFTFISAEHAPGCPPVICGQRQPLRRSPSSTAAAAAATASAAAAASAASSTPVQPAGTRPSASITSAGLPTTSGTAAPARPAAAAAATPIAAPPHQADIELTDKRRPGERGTF